jgi:hypothetical protein
LLSYSHGYISNVTLSIALNAPTRTYTSNYENATNVQAGRDANFTNPIRSFSASISEDNRARKRVIPLVQNRLWGAFYTIECMLERRLQKVGSTYFALRQASLNNVSPTVSGIMC